MGMFFSAANDCKQSANHLLGKSVVCSPSSAIVCVATTTNQQPATRNHDNENRQFKSVSMSVSSVCCVGVGVCVCVVGIRKHQLWVMCCRSQQSEICDPCIRSTIRVSTTHTPCMSYHSQVCVCVCLCVCLMFTVGSSISILEDQPTLAFSLRFSFFP